MKQLKTTVINIVIVTSIALFSCDTENKSNNRTPHPENQRTSDLGNGTYLNPILGGDYPDPSVLKYEDAYYMTHSSFKYSPGLLIWKSYDLINWEPVCNALNEYLGSVYAPDFIEHEGEFYIYFPVMGCVDTTKEYLSNHVVVADHPEGPWSRAYDLKVSHIDPGHVVDEKGNRYVHLSGGNIVKLNDEGTLAVGDVKKVYDGWQYPEDWLAECFCLESPKLLKKDGWYYLTSAQGGTAGPATSHMVVSARSKTHEGPWENSPHNPIVHTESPDETWWSKGHGTVFEGPKGQWYCMYHGYQKNYYTLGRQTLMEPIEWTDDGWFRVPDEIQTDQPIAAPSGKKVESMGYLSDDFQGEDINIMWRFWEEYDTSRFSIKNGKLHLKAKGNDPSDCSPMMIIPTNENYEIKTKFTISENASGGLLLFYNPEGFAGLDFSFKGLGMYRPMRKNPGHGIETEAGNTIYLKINNTEHHLRYYYSYDGENWTMYPSGAESSGMHHNVFGQFMSLRAGIFAAGDGEVIYEYFNYKGI